LEEESYRLFICVLCSSQVKLCRLCDRGNIYCSKACSAKQRRASKVRARRRYQKSFRGALKHSVSQDAYRVRQKQKVMDQGSSKLVLNVIVLKTVGEEENSQPQVAVEPSKKEQVPCGLCGVMLRSCVLKN
jgi:hypothetical protein